MKPLDLLKAHCEFITDYDCYVLLAVSRKKDVPEITNSQEVVFREVIKNPKDIERKYRKIKSMVDNYKNEKGKKLPFYIYVSLNRRDAKKASFSLIRSIMRWVEEESNGVGRSQQLKKLYGYYYSALMKQECKSAGTKYFMIDFDTKDETMKNHFEHKLKDLTEIIIINETRNGYHYKVKPFNRLLLLDTSYYETKTDANFFVTYVENKE